MASQWPPKKNTAYTLYFTLFKTDGTIVANPGTFTKKVSVDGAAVADITAAVTEENTTYGQCSIVLDTSEMNGDAIWVYLVDDTAGCVPYIVTLYTAANTQDEVMTAVTAIKTKTDFLPSATAGAAGGVFIAGTNAATAITTALTADITGNLSGSVGSVTGNVGGNVTGSVGSVVGDIGGLAAGAITDVEAAVWDATLASHVGAGTTGGAVDAILTDTGTTIPGTLATLATAAALATVDTVVDAILVNTDTTIPALIVSETNAVQADIAALNNLSAAQVNAEVLDVLNVDTFAEPTGVPPATSTIQQKLSRVYMALRNGVTVTATDKTFLDDGGAAEWRKPLADDGTVYTEGEGTTP